MGRLERWVVLASLCAAAGLPAYSQEKSQEKPRKTELTSRIDQILDSQWSKGSVAPPADDGEFLRRLSLDLRGTPPGEEEARTFLTGTSPTKRLEKIDEYLASPEYAQFWTGLWADVMYPNYRDVYVQSGKNLSRGTSRRMMKEFLKWFAEQLAKDTPVPKILADLLEAYGKSEDSPLTIYKLSFYNGGNDAPLEFADGFSKTWLGVRVSCARCHDHPFDHWSKEHFYGLAAFFARQRVNHFGGRKKDDCDELELYEEARGDLSMPESSKVMPPTYLYGGRAGSTEARMTALIRLVLADREVKQFARGVSNRVWGLLLGRGIVNPVDDFNRNNKPLYPDVLSALATDFEKHRYSLKHLIRSICATRAYQLSSAKDGETVTEDFSRHITRELRTEQLLNSLIVATRGPEMVQKRGDGHRRLWDQFADQLRLVYGPGVSYNESTVLPGNTRQALMMRNSEFVNGLLRGRTLAGATPEEKVDRAFVAILSRPPREGEMQRWVGFLNARGSLEDLTWTLINSTEFTTRH